MNEEVPACPKILNGLLWRTRSQAVRSVLYGEEETGLSPERGIGMHVLCLWVKALVLRKICRAVLL